MNNNLLIVGAGIYGLVAKEIAESMNCFDKIAFVDDKLDNQQGEINILGSINEAERFLCDYNNIIVAIGNAQVRLSLLKKFEALPCKIVTLICPHAYVAPSAKIEEGTIIEPMAVAHTQVKISKGCIISAGAVLNHASVCCEGVHVDCNATVKGGVVVPARTKIESGEVFKNENDDVSKRTPQSINGKTYSFDDIM